jgi:hypothetical protein
LCADGDLGADAGADGGGDSTTVFVHSPDLPVGAGEKAPLVSGVTTPSESAAVEETAKRSTRRSRGSRSSVLGTAGVELVGLGGP